MATASTSSRHGLEKLSWYLANNRHTVWDRFSPETQRSLIEEDLTAGKSVSMVLISVISAGMVMSMIALAYVLMTS